MNGALSTNVATTKREADSGNRTDQQVAVTPDPGAGVKCNALQIELSTRNRPGDVTDFADLEWVAHPTFLLRTRAAPR